MSTLVASALTINRNIDSMTLIIPHLSSHFHFRVILYSRLYNKSIKWKKKISPCES